MIILKLLEVYGNTIEQKSLDDNGVMNNFPPNSVLFKFKQKLTSETGTDGTDDVEIMKLKCLSNFWGTLKMPLINWEVNLTLTWSANCVVSDFAANQAATFAITDTKLYVTTATLSTKDNAKLL